MKPGVKDVVLDQMTVTVIYDDDRVSTQNFSDMDSAQDYCASFGGRQPVAAPAKAEPKKPESVVKKAVKVVKKALKKGAGK